MPVELFTEIGQAVRRASPYPHTFFFGYSNGLLGYLPTAEAHRQGGYEPTTSPVTGRAETDVIRAVLAEFKSTEHCPESVCS